MGACAKSIGYTYATYSGRVPPKRDTKQQQSGKGAITRVLAGAVLANELMLIAQSLHWVGYVCWPVQHSREMELRSLLVEFTQGEVGVRFPN